MIDGESEVIDGESGTTALFMAKGDKGKALMRMDGAMFALRHSVTQRQRGGHRTAAGRQHRHPAGRTADASGGDQARQRRGGEATKWRGGKTTTAKGMMHKRTTTSTELSRRR